MFCWLLLLFAGYLGWRSGSLWHWWCLTLQMAVSGPFVLSQYILAPLSNFLIIPLSYPEVLRLSFSVHVACPPSYLLASFPGPTQLSIACGTEKRERSWYFFSHEWRRDRKDSRMGLIVCLINYHMYLASGKRMSYTPSIVHVVSWTICKMQPVSSANVCHFPITSSHVRKDTKLSPLFHPASNRKLGGTWV